MYIVDSGIEENEITFDTVFYCDLKELKLNNDDLMYLKEKIKEMVDLVSNFVRNSGGYPIIWVSILNRLEEAVELIQNNPEMTLEEFKEKMGIEEE